jgi:hypothetical protein
MYHKLLFNYVKNSWVKVCNLKLLSLYLYMKRLENRGTESESRNNMVSMIDLYEQYVDESIQTIRIWTSTMYIINDKWVVDITTNRVSISYPAPIG